MGLASYPIRDTFSGMRLDEKGFHNDVVRLDMLEEGDRARLEVSDAVQSMWDWLPVIPKGTNFHAYVDFMLAMKKQGSIIPFSITRQSDDAFAGVIAYLDVSRTHRRVGIGYVWHPPEMRGTVVPVATQMAMIGRAFGARMRRIEFPIAAGNERAIRALERLGARQEGVLRRYMRLADGSWSDLAILSLVDAEIRAAVDLLKDRVAQMQLA
ncbi:GNAT family protein [Hyphomonas sp. BRH_c22]|uniref:GNAT family N-acetyltransferase n=1 Tax=Hyphomonas sp. BRH_c22 TaxID=1629710 RepID=UPI0026282D5E|nr:GNAT family protein [Hyphomonas sp. BRH_c22]